jgi:hypothetical protein
MRRRRPNRPGFTKKLAAVAKQFDIPSRAQVRSNLTWREIRKCGAHAETERPLDRAAPDYGFFFATLHDDAITECAKCQVQLKDVRLERAGPSIDITM